MAKTKKADISDDSEVEEVPKNKRAAADESEEADSGAESEEYEIEAILDAKHGSFAGGKMGYLVKWKNYTEEHNSWVNEDDAANAQNLIDIYWKRRSKAKKAARKSETKSITSSARKRKSSPAVSEAESVPAAKKRGRPSKAKSERAVSDEDDQALEVPKKGRGSLPARKGTSTAKKNTKPASDAMDEDEPEDYVDMSKNKNIATWEHLVDHIDTVERTEEGKLWVYFRL
ncbi:hypothetical protein PHLCEN_2v6023 [Hermanssonia centrifuga]|uniref:Chromo domain-containing protein n=1 Tax=Hermanssonia centrifuga TaxID=98765 RepID=A0A2R6P0M1_9APHY|nr:hypothetical protein PHLCEN_2v6023 [Hermanssonia centrifuga]